jgi:hypothetical protein
MKDEGGRLKKKRIGNQTTEKRLKKLAAQTLDLGLWTDD